jgi:hypothetical protein
MDCSQGGLMLSRMKERLGAAGLAVAILALVAAVAGTAFAALPGLNSKQKKQVTSIATTQAKKFAKGATGPTGPAGPAGAAGQAGAQGPAGPTGPTGKDGKDGEPGVCSVSNPECVAPPGATFTGSWAAGGTKPGPEELTKRVFTAFSFPLRLEAPINNAENAKVVGEGESGVEGCPGSVTEPDADPGFLCVYVEFEQNVNGVNILNAGDLSSGAILVWEPEPGETVAVQAGGTWAVTAPE